ncbi:unnamed protein product [Pleuronectes platessa]|uniref:Uncharacterized protein n=1 Tax=Pleuronectes platessa TaxID=8262 RepID=A0A9N7YZW8_PLEPL|nr:unnamed protein product [Pleuronectes platessa]
MASTCLYAPPTTSGHAPDESADGVLGDLLPDLDQGVSELLDSLWQYLAFEPALICEYNNVPVADLPVLVYYGECQSSCRMLGWEHRSHYNLSGPHASLMESVSDSLVRNMHMVSQYLLEYILLGDTATLPGRLWVGSSIPSLTHLNAEVSLGKMLNPEWPPIE